MKSFLGTLLACAIFAGGGWFARESVGWKFAAVAPEAPAPVAQRFASALCALDAAEMLAATDPEIRVSQENIEVFLMGRGPENCTSATYIGKFSGEDYTTYFFSINADSSDWLAIRVNAKGLVEGMTY